MRATIPHLALAAAEAHRDREAIVDGAVRLSFAQLRERMMETAAAFVAAGLQPGERVALWAPNGRQWVVACLGLHAAGGVVVPLNTRFKGAEAQFILNRSRAAMLVMADSFLGTAYPALLDGLPLPALRRRIRLDADGPDGWPAFLAGATDAARAEARARLDALTGESLSDIMFTSGTTGEPKGALATHGQTVATTRLWIDATTLGPGDRFLILWPFFHCAGYKSGWVACLGAGATILPAATLDVERLVATVAAEKVTFFPGPPPLFQALLSQPDRESLASLRVSITGATSIAPGLIRAMREDLRIPVVLTGYGLTESCGTVTMSRPTDAPETIATSCGRAIPGIEIRCVDEAGRPLPPGEAGEVLVRGMNVMRGYLDDPAATAAAIDADGWLRTGDVGVLDADGYLHITDRKKDIFISGGFNCYPAEIEKIILTHPAVAQVAVKGVPDERMGEVGMAHVVLRPGTDLTADALARWCRRTMANFKVPRHFVFTDALPTNATGKVQKFRLGGPSGEAG